ncbi:MAG: cytochrome c [Myxococcota bacterium]
MFRSEAEPADPYATRRARGRFPGRPLAPRLALLSLCAAGTIGLACSGEREGESERSVEAARAVEGRGDIDGTARPAPAAPTEGALTPAEIAHGTAAKLALVPEQHDWTKGDPERGKALYRLYCLVCHGEDGEGDGVGAATLNPKPRDFTSGSFSFDANADGKTGSAVDIARVIRESPSAFGGSKAMPAWGGTFSVEQVADLVAYVRSLAGPRAASSSSQTSSSPGPSSREAPSEAVM